MTGFCPYKKGSLKGSECHYDGYCSECPHNTKDDTISRQAAIDAVLDRMDVEKHGRDAKPEEIQWTLEKLPSAQPEPISEEYARAVRTWLMDYQIRSAKLQGRYTPYEVLGWVVNDWEKENGIW